MRPATIAACALAPALLVATGAARAAEGHPDWQALRDVSVIEVITTDEDGDLRETPVWFVLVDGDPYLRTSDSRWLANILRGSPVPIVIEGLEYEVDAVPVDGDAIRAEVDAASAEKYGFQESVIRFFRVRPPDVLRIVPKR